MIIINLKDLYASDSQQQITDKVNYNFNQMLRLGIGEPGPIGPAGPIGPQGIIGIQGIQGLRGNYWSSSSDDTPVVSGSIENDFCVTTGLNNEKIWQKTGATWIEKINFRQMVQESATLTSPFVRTPNDPANWKTIILPLSPVGVQTYNNSLLMAAENQDLLYTGTETLSNSTQLMKSQATFLSTSAGSGATSMPYSIMIGEVSYDYNGTSVYYANPKVGINNTLRISTKLIHPSGGGVPVCSRSEFDMFTIDSGVAQYGDTSNMFIFKNRHYTYGSVGPSYGTRIPTETYIGPGRAMLGNGLTSASNSMGDVLDSPNIDFSGLSMRNNGTLAFSIGTSVDLLKPYAYLLTNGTINRIYVNNNFIPYKKTLSDTRNLGMSSTDAKSHWDTLFLRQGIGYDNIDLKFWRNTGSNTSYSSSTENCTLTLSKEGTVGIGKSISTYSSTGNISGLDFGDAPLSVGNSKNKAVLRIYENMTSVPDVFGINEAGLIVEKKWGFLDGTAIAYGTKYAAYLNNTVSVSSSSVGTGGATFAPSATALGIYQSQSSTSASGIVSKMTGIDVTLHTASNSSYITDLVGIKIATDFVNPATSTTRISSYKALHVYVQPVSVANNIVSDTDELGNIKRYGIYQDGSLDTLNYFSGHMQFSGENTDGVYTPDSDVNKVKGHTISVLGNNVNNGGNLSIFSAHSIAGDMGGAVTGGNLSLIAGRSATGYGTSTGGTSYLAGGNSWCGSRFASNGGNVNIFAGTAVGTYNHIQSISQGGTIVIKGGDAQSGGSAAPAYSGLLILSSGKATRDAGVTYTYGKIAVGYDTTLYNVGQVGIGTVGHDDSGSQHTSLKAKLEVNGNLSISPAGSSYADAFDESTTKVRRLYVRRGVTTAVNGVEGPGYGTSLVIQAGGAYSSTGASQSGGDLFLCGGYKSGHAGWSDSDAGIGSTILAYDFDTSAFGRVGIRRMPELSQTQYVTLHHKTEVDGGIMTNGDISWGNFTSDASGWQTLVSYNSGADYNPASTGVYFYNSAGTVLTINDCYISITYKRIGSVAIINIGIDTGSTCVLKDHPIVLISWNPSAVASASLGIFAGTRFHTAPYLNYCDPSDISHSIIRCNEHVASVSSARSSGAYGQILFQNNVLAIRKISSDFGTLANIRGQIVCAMQV